MTDNEKQFENFVRDIRFDDAPDANHRDRLEQRLIAAMAKQSRQKVSPLTIWRTIMSMRITKLTAVAAVIIIAALGIIFFEKSTKPAWAIEQTIKELDMFDAVQIIGIAIPEDSCGIELPINQWARANKDHTDSNNFLLETSDGRITEWVHENSTFHYDSKQNTVIVLRNQPSHIGRWLDRELLQKLQQTENAQVLYGKDAGTNREHVFVTWCSDPNAPVAQSYWFEFDLESKLPVSFKQWDNLFRKGKPAFYAQRIIYYENLPDEFFEFEIPEGATVIEKN